MRGEALEAETAPFEVDSAQGGCERGRERDREEGDQDGVEEDDGEDEELRGFEAEQVHKGYRCERSEDDRARAEA